MLVAGDLDEIPDAISGEVILAPEVEIPECPAGSPRSIQDFVPIATGVGVVDGEGEPIVRSGVVTGPDGTFVIGSLAPGAYSLSYEPSFDFEGATLSIEATVSSDGVLLGDLDVGGVEYVIESATCGVSE